MVSTDVQIASERGSECELFETQVHGLSMNVMTDPDSEGRAGELIDRGISHEEMCQENIRDAIYNLCKTKRQGKL
jgi:hypothetical protein